MLVWPLKNSLHTLTVCDFNTAIIYSRYEILNEKKKKRAQKLAKSGDIYDSFSSQSLACADNDDAIFSCVCAPY